MGDTENVHSQLEASIPTTSAKTMYTLNDVDRLAEYSARSYMTNITAANSCTLYQSTQMNAANVAAAFSQSIPNGTDGKHYPIPDISKYVYDRFSGLHYDATTGLYYHASSTYYWNSVIQKYLYWDREKLSYVLALTKYENSANQNQTTPLVTAKTKNKKPKGEKKVKRKMGTKIAKDIERWSKVMESYKKAQNLKNAKEMAQSNNQSGSDSLSVGLSVLEKSENNGYKNLEAYGESGSGSVSAGFSVTKCKKTKTDSQSTAPFCVATCESPNKENILRKLNSASALSKQVETSPLHKQNWVFQLNKRKAQNCKRIVDRDHVKVDRIEYGDHDKPQSSKLEQKALKSRKIVELPVTAPVYVGNRGLQKMGWTEGQGPAKADQERIKKTQADLDNTIVSSGSKSSNSLTKKYRKTKKDSQLTFNSSSVAASGELMLSDEKDWLINNWEFLDYTKLVCTLCKHRVNTAAALSKHALSTMHKENCEDQWKKEKASNPEKAVYRDRASERRMKCRNLEVPRPSELKEQHLKLQEIKEVPFAAPVPEPITYEGIGKKLLQKMGWTEGQGLGKNNQGRTTIAQIEFYCGGVGLGNKTSSYKEMACQLYNDFRKKITYIRYQKLLEKD